ncbi:MAG: hypothetical protein U5L96_10260 [Owenweeksia sp.]|nr:hypothetical protein [Owenweeksia sp.]
MVVFILHIKHLKGLLSAAADYGLQQVYVHAFTDGRDTDPQRGLEYISEVENHLANTTGSIASIIGRYYAMDRDKRWERTKEAYNLLVHGQGQSYTSAAEGITASYESGVTDEFIKPIILKPEATMEEGDVVVCFNFRTDRGRQITTALTQRDFMDYGMKKLKLHYVTMTRYDEAFKGIDASQWKKIIYTTHLAKFSPMPENVNYA